MRLVGFNMGGVISTLHVEYMSSGKDWYTKISNFVGNHKYIRINITYRGNDKWQIFMNCKERLRPSKDTNGDEGIRFSGDKLLNSGSSFKRFDYFRNPSTQFNIYNTEKNTITIDKITKKYWEDECDSGKYKDCKGI